ncbi:hypothetical protein DRK59_01555 [Salmonella enterica subsp. diarizonae]|nr:hypothetical protein [Salmonella enterica]EAQ6114220.1 hypothetical protein [Salmonella enterica]ECE0107105.1 hypothetical protein [Salmonella enterica subsp. diarizonae]MLU15911.1 hypothetical protein [Salmonella enterica subsp. diarizonae]
MFSLDDAIINFFGGYFFDRHNVLVQRIDTLEYKRRRGLVNTGESGFFLFLLLGCFLNDKVY